MALEKRGWGKTLTKAERETAEATFLCQFAKTANMTRACRKAGVSRTTVYRWVEEEGGEFKARYEVAEKEANDVIRAEIHRRAITGILEPIHYQGERVDLVRKYSDTLLIFLAKARMAEFRESTQHILTGDKENPVRITYVDGDKEA